MGAPYRRHMKTLKELRSLVDDFGLDMDPGLISKTRDLPENQQPHSVIKSIRDKVDKCGGRLESLTGCTRIPDSLLIALYRFVETLAVIVVDHSWADDQSWGTEDATTHQDDQSRSGKAQPLLVAGQTETDEREDHEQHVDEEDTKEKWRTDEKNAEIDDVIIYRYLMLALLFRTVPDSSQMLESGLWDQIVPII